jgi:hypothetical protein
VHPPDVSKLLPKPFFDSIYAMTDKISGSAPANAAKDTENVHALTILARVTADSKLTLPTDLDELMILQNTLDQHSDAIRDYAMQWSIDLNRPGEINRKVEEIAWMNTVIFGVAGWTWAQQVEQGREGDFNADFFLLSVVLSFDHIHTQPLPACTSLHLQRSFHLFWPVSVTLLNPRFFFFARTLP